MLFKKKDIEMVLVGKKTQTRRVPGKSANYQVGRIYSIRDRWFSKARAYILITRKFRQRLGEISPEDVRKEGYNSLEEFHSAWEEVNGEGSWDPNQIVIPMNSNSFFLSLPRLAGSRIHLAPGSGAQRDRIRGLKMSEIAKTENRAAGATKQSADVKGKLVEYLWHLKKNGLCEATVKGYISKLNTLINYGVDILDPEAVKLFLAGSTKWGGSSKQLAVTAYDGFVEMLKIKWEPPKYKRVEKMPFIPTEEEIDSLISAAGKKTATLLQLLKETGMRIGEALQTKWIDVDLQRRVITVTPEKGSRPRILPMSEKLIAMLQRLPRKSELVFPASYKGITLNFYTQRKNIAEKLGNPRIRKISLHTFRHWKGTMEYHRTKDIIHVQQFLGHRNIQSTMIYITVEAALFQQLSHDFHVKTAKTVEEAEKLIETGFEFIHEFNGVMLFRKRK